MRIVMMTIIMMLPLLLTPPLGARAGAAEVIEGEIVGVSDGDTLTLLTDDKRQVKIRLYGIDCPESRQAYGNRARQAVSKMAFRRHARVDVADRDRYGRTVGIVMSDFASVRSVRNGGRTRRPPCGRGAACGMTATPFRLGNGGMGRGNGLPQ